MSKGAWTHGQTANRHDLEFEQCAEPDCIEWVYWRDKQDHLEHVHGVFTYKGILVNQSQLEPDPLHVRVEHLKAYIARTKNAQLRYELRRGLIRLESQLAAITLTLTGGNNHDRRTIDTGIGTEIRSDAENAIVH